MTRHPNNTPGKKWSIKQLDAIPLDWAKDMLADGDGLRGEVRVSSNDKVSINFKYGFRWEDKLSWYYCGTYPDKDLSLIREERDQAKRLIKAGLNPKTYKEATKIENQSKAEAKIQENRIKQTLVLTVDDLFKVWIDQGVNRLDNNHSLKLSFQKHVLPIIGNKLIKDLSEIDLLRIYKGIIKEKKNRTAVRTANDISQMLSWAEKRKPWRQLMVDGNPADLVNIKKLLPNDYSEERSRILSPKEILALNFAINNLKDKYSKSKNKYDIERPLKEETSIAIWICLSTLCRIGELMKAEWKDIDFKKNVWFIPLSNSKGTSGKKQDQYVYLSNFAVKYFKDLKELTGQSKWLFPATNNESNLSEKTMSKQIGDRQIKFKNRKALKNRANSDSLVIGEDEWTLHDLRRTGATLMQELKVPLDVIDRCQNHVLSGSKVRRHYLKYDYAEEKKEAWVKLGNYIESLIMNNKNNQLKKIK